MEILGSNPTFLYLKNFVIFTQRYQKQSSETPTVVSFREKYALT